MSTQPGPLKIAVLAPTLAPAGGLCRWSRELVRGLEIAAPADDLAVDVLVRSSMDSAHVTIEKYGLRCRLHPISADTSGTLAALTSVRSVGRLLAQLQPDVIYTPLSWIWLLSDRREVQPVIVATAHGEPRVELTNRLNRIIARFLHRRGHVQLTASAPALTSEVDEVLKVRPGSTVFIQVGTDLDDKQPEVGLREVLSLAEGELVVMTLTRLTPGKRVGLVLDVAERARSNNLMVRFVVCGSGPEFKSLTEDAERRQLQGWIHFLGHVANPASLLRDADVVLHPSDSEGFPFAMIESLLAGTPIVATDVGGMRDIVARPQDGLLVRKGDVGQLYDALIKILERQPDRAELTQAAARRFNVGRMGEAHLTLIQNLLAE